MQDNTVPSTPALRLALLGDAGASLGTGLLLAAAAAPLSGLLGLPEPLLRVAGLILLPYAALVAWVGSRRRPACSAVRAVVAVNAVWVADSLLLLAAGPALAGLTPGALGIAFVLAQAAVVGGFACAQWAALRSVSQTQAHPALA
jgi:hypothetical protein